MAIDDNTTYGLLGSQVKDLANNVNAKATITMTSTDPGEGSPLAANHYIAVYGTMGSLLDMFYPVGSYYETSDTTFNPNTAWGGTWLEDSAGRSTIAYDSTDTDFNTVGNTGGSKELQEHTHTAGTYDGYALKNDGVAAGSGPSAVTINTSSTTSSARIRTNAAGTGNSGNLSPYVVVKRWHRTA